MPFNIPLHQLDTPVVKQAAGADGVLWSTAAALRDGSREPVDPGSATLLFEEDFSQQPNWNSAGLETASGTEFWADEGDPIPAGWDAARVTSGWSESKGYPGGKETLYITDEPEFQMTPGTKSMVYWGSFRDTSAYWCDGILAKAFQEGLNEAFIKFNIKFGPGWINRYAQKIFRIQGWGNLEKSDFWSSDQIYPGFIWAPNQSNYGTRNNHALRSWPRNSDLWNNPPLINLPRPFVSSSLDLNWGENTYDWDDDGIVDNDPQIPDLVNGGVFPNTGASFDHTQVWGTQWHELQFYIKMNSAPGAQDGIIAQWRNGRIIWKNTSIPWAQSDAESVPALRAIKFGGNCSNYRGPDGVPDPVSNEDRLQHWYAITGIKIYDGLPSGISL